MLLGSGAGSVAQRGWAGGGAELGEERNERVQAGTLVERVDEKAAEPFDGGRIREDGKILFPIRQDIPVMLIDQGIPLGQ